MDAAILAVECWELTLRSIPIPVACDAEASSTFFGAIFGKQSAVCSRSNDEKTVVSLLVSDHAWSTPELLVLGLDTVSKPPPRPHYTVKWIYHQRRHAATPSRK